MSTKITVTWSPEGGIPGNNKGVVSWASKFDSIKVFNSITGQMETLPGTHKVNLDVVAPTKGNKTCTYVFFQIGKTKPIGTFSVRVLSQPLVFIRWVPTFEFDKKTGERNGVGTVKIRALGATKVNLFGTEINIPTLLPSNSYDVPFNIPAAYAIPLRENGKTELSLILPVTVPDGTQKKLRINLIIG